MKYTRQETAKIRSQIQRYVWVRMEDITEEVGNMDNGRVVGWLIAIGRTQNSLIW